MHACSSSGSQKFPFHFRTGSSLATQQKADVHVDVKVVTPGDGLLQLPKNGKLRIGTGIYVDEDQLVTNRCGVARQTKAGKVWVGGRQKR